MCVNGWMYLSNQSEDRMNTFWIKKTEVLRNIFEKNSLMKEGRKLSWWKTESKDKQLTISKGEGHTYIWRLEVMVKKDRSNVINEDEKWIPWGALKWAVLKAAGTPGNGWPSAWIAFPLLGSLLPCGWRFCLSLIAQGCSSCSHRKVTSGWNRNACGKKKKWQIGHASNIQEFSLPLQESGSKTLQEQPDKFWRFSEGQERGSGPLLTLFFMGHGTIKNEMKWNKTKQNKMNKIKKQIK